MLEVLAGFPSNVIACTAKGRVRKNDYDDVLIPAVEQALHANPKIRCYYELGPEFTGFDAGAAWDDFTIGVEHLTRWECVAIVTDVKWLHTAANVFRFLMPGSLRSFTMAQSAEAKQWITTP